MTFKAILWTYGPRKNGQCAVKIYCRFKGKSQYFPTGISVVPEDWDESRGQVTRSHPLAQQMNAKIRNLALELESKALNGETLPSRKEQKPSKATVSISEFITTYVNEVNKGQHDIRLVTAKHYVSLKLRLDQYAVQLGRPVEWEDINIEWYRAFWSFLSENFQITKEGGFAKHIKNLKKFMREGLRRGLHKNKVYEDKDFKVYRSQDQKIYLNEKEIELLEKLDLSHHPWLETERDRWLLCYYFLMRYQDGQDHIVRENFFESEGKTFFRYNAQKTGIAAILPVKPKALELLEKYNYQMPKTTNAEANRKIKQIASMAGINTPATENGVTAPKWTFVRTHTARRSAATNLAMGGATLDFICKLGGWKKLETLEKYLLATRMEVARISGDFEFFR